MTFTPHTPPEPLPAGYWDSIAPICWEPDARCRAIRSERGFWERLSKRRGMLHGAGCYCVEDPGYRPGSPDTFYRAWISVMGLCGVTGEVQCVDRDLETAKRGAIKMFCRLVPGAEVAKIWAAYSHDPYPYRHDYEIQYVEDP
jgi:hypothetical protein